MSGFDVQSLSQISSEHIVNALPEGILIAFFAWLLLHILPRQNSGTRFAVWFLTLLTIALLPALAAFGDRTTLGISAAFPATLKLTLSVPSQWASYLFIFWICGASLALMRLGAGLWRLHQLRRSCSPLYAEQLDPAIVQTLEAISGPVSPAKRWRSKATSLAVSDQVRMPAAIGFWKPMIVLPAWALRELSAVDLNAVLMHERAHLLRRDDWTNLVQKIVRAVFFFHPAVWWIEKQLSVEREMACDEAVLAETANPQGYARCLVSLLEKNLAHRLSGKSWSLAQAVVHRAREASMRLAQILDRDRPRATGVWKPAIVMISAFGIACLMAMPVTPQFVAFDRTAGFDRAVALTAVAEAPSVQAPLPAAMVVPVRLRRDASNSSVTIAKNHAQVLPKRLPRVVNRPAEEPVRLDLQNALIEASLDAEQQPSPKFETLVFVQARRYRNANDAVWRVEVWQVTFVSGSAVQQPELPVANSI